MSEERVLTSEKDGQLIVSILKTVLETKFTPGDLIKIRDDAKKDLINSVYPITIVSNDEKKEELIAIPKSKFEEWFGEIQLTKLYIDNLRFGDSS